MQYLGGYVIQKLSRRVRYSKTAFAQIQTAILESAIETDDENKSSQALVSALNRGGLCYISKTTQHIFLLSEKYFQRKTQNKAHHSLKCNKMITDIVSFSYVKDIMIKLCQGVAENLKADENFNEIMKITLFKMVQLYIRVRVFSLAKDFMQKHRILKQQRSKEKSLRRTLKKSNGKKVGFLFYDVTRGRIEIGPRDDVGRGSQKRWRDGGGIHLLWSIH